MELWYFITKMCTFEILNVYSWNKSVINVNTLIQ